MVRQEAAEDDVFVGVGGGVEHGADGAELVGADGEVVVLGRCGIGGGGADVGGDLDEARG